MIDIIKGGSHRDDRGTVSFVNDFDFRSVKRFYTIHHHDASVVRAWQGHRTEHKFFFVNKGSFVLAWVKVDEWDQPSKDLQPAYSILKEEEPVILSIPPGYANGIKALSKDSMLTVFSDHTLSESANDRWSFDPALWLDWSKF